MTDTLTKNDSCCQTPDATKCQSSVTYSPRFDIWETDDELVVYSDLPGVAPDDLDIRFENREVTIRGKVSPHHADRCGGEPHCDGQGSAEHAVDDRAPAYGEYGIGDFYRTFSVAETIDSDKISAELNHGVLTLHLPKTEEVKPRRIQVTGEG